MTAIVKKRIASIDLLKGLVMVIMALDHVRDYFHYSAFYFDPADPQQSTLPIFFTRWITHFCAPAFSFLAGMSAFLVGMRKSKKDLAVFLLTRGIWLVFVEMVIVNFAWFFDLSFSTPGLLVIWALGVSMIVLAGLIFLPQKVILFFSLLLIAGHNLLDGVHFPGNIAWSVLHEFSVVPLGANRIMLIGYPLIPWIAVMALGYYFGQFYVPGFNAQKRRRLYNLLGIGMLILFGVLRLTKLYGDPVLFHDYPGYTGDIISLFDPSKYPPSLQYLLMTLGAAFIFLANSENWKGKLVNFFTTFGRVPFFYYIVHLYVIHLGALVAAELTGFQWQQFILKTWVTEEHSLRGYGFPLWIVYLIWIALILALYPLCRWFDRYKQANKDKRWLSYL